MSLVSTLKNLFPLDHPLRLLYHKLRAVVAAVVFGFPASHMIVIGVTGTDGKTTTCNMIVAILKQAGYTVGLISTVYCMIGEEIWMNETKMTSLDPFIMNRYLARMKKAGCRYVVLETSSHAILYNRIWGVNVDVAVLTHISSDHLDLHRTLRNYVQTKKTLFLNLNYSQRKPTVSKVAVLNSDDQYFDEFDEEVTADKKYTYGIQKKSYVSGSNVAASPLTVEFDLQLANVMEHIALPLSGSFNVYNALAAITVGLSQNISLALAKEALEHFSGVAGRMERVQAGQPFITIVDYAHTTDALHQVLSAIKPVTKGKLFLVFGATGDRDKTKRPLMGTEADRYADMIIVTDDDPYTENRLNIIQEVLSGIKRQENKGLWIIPDREQAIKTALFLAQEGDIVLITGKGAEQVLVTNQGKIPWDDRQIAKKYILQRFPMASQI